MARFQNQNKLLLLMCRPLSDADVLARCKAGPPLRLRPISRQLVILLLKSSHILPFDSSKCLFWKGMDIRTRS